MALVKRNSKLLGATLGFGVVACGGGDTTCVGGHDSEGACAGDIDVKAAELDRFATSVSMDALSTDLDLGSKGSEVQLIHDYLKELGYFPNEDLERRYWRWRPIIGASPALEDVYDEQTQAAVKAFQSLASLPQTGVVDEETRAVMRMPRCGFPDGIVAPDPSWKYDLGNGKWNSNGVRWRVMNVTGSGLTQAQVEQAAGGAFARWTEASGISFSRDHLGVPDVEISFRAFSGPTLGDATYPDDGGDDAGGTIRVDNSSRIWSVDGTPAAGENDLQTLLLHEIGHALGLAHSSVVGATMLGTVPRIDRALAPDDIVASNVLYPDWDCSFDDARDIGVGYDGADPGQESDHVWKVSSALTTGGFRVYKKQGTSWVEATGGQGALRIDVAPDGRPWIVSNDNKIFRRTTNRADSGTWERLDGCATDIGVGGVPPQAWVIGCGDNTIWRWDEAARRWRAPTPGVGIRIDVDSAGNPWVVGDDFTIWHRVTVGCPAGANGCWEGVDGTASDIGVGAANYAWRVGNADVLGGAGSLHVWNEQPSGGGTPSAVKRRGWINMHGAVKAISADEFGRAWFVSADGDICHLRHL